MIETLKARKTQLIDQVSTRFLRRNSSIQKQAFRSTQAVRILLLRMIGRDLLMSPLITHLAAKLGFFITNRKTMHAVIDRMYNAFQHCWSAELQPWSTDEVTQPTEACVCIAHHASFMPAAKGRPRPQTLSKDAVQNCAQLLSVRSNKLVKVRSIGKANSQGVSEVQVRFNLVTPLQADCTSC